MYIRPTNSHAFSLISRFLLYNYAFTYFFPDATQLHSFSFISFSYSQFYSMKHMVTHQFQIIYQLSYSEIFFWVKSETSSSLTVRKVHLLPSSTLQNPKYLCKYYIHTNLTQMNIQMLQLSEI